MIHEQIWNFNSNLDMGLLRFNGSDIYIYTQPTQIYNMLIKRQGVDPIPYIRTLFSILQGFYSAKSRKPLEQIQKLFCNLWRLNIFFDYFFFFRRKQPFVSMIIDKLYLGDLFVVFFI